MRIKVKVIPKASNKRIKKLGKNSYKIHLTAPPVDGKANKQLIELIADKLNISKSQVKIVRGETSRKKVIEIDVG